MFDPWLLFAALIVEACVGYPHALYRAIGHPVVWIGIALAALERRLNRPEFGDLTRRVLGVVTVVIVTGGAAGVGYIVQALASNVSFGAVVVILIASTGLAQHSLFTHVRAVLQPLANGDLVTARREVAQIVGHARLIQ